MSNAATTAVSNAAPGANVGQGKEGNAWHEFDILAAVVSRYQNAAPKKPQSPEHRISCHRCGNIRKRRILCTRATCPHTFCGRCAEKMKEEHGLDVFFGGCPVCKELCCCNNKSVFCHRKNHCYRKCPATKTNGKQANITVKDDSDSEPYHEELHNIPKPENGQYGIFDLLAAVADMDKTQALAKQSTKVPAGVAAAPSSSSSAAGGPRKKAKTGKEGTTGGKDVYPSSMLLCEPSYAQYFSSSVPESVGNMQLLNSKGLTAPDSGVDGYTFNNNTMGIIRGGLGGVTDAIALMGQQKPNKAGKFNVGMDPASFTMMSATDPLLANLAAAPTAAATTAGAATAASGAGGSGSASYNRLPSIDNNPFSAAGAGLGSTTAPTASAGGAPVRDAAAFDQALLDSVRTIQQDPFNAALPRQLPSVPRPGPGAPAATAAAPAPSSSSSAGAAPAPSSSSSAGAAPALEPMNLLALVSSITPAATASSASSEGGDNLQASKLPSAASLAPQDAADGGGN